MYWLELYNHPFFSSTDFKTKILSVGLFYLPLLPPPTAWGILPICALNDGWIVALSYCPNLIIPLNLPAQDLTLCYGPEVILLGRRWRRINSRHAFRVGIGENGHGHPYLACVFSRLLANFKSQSISWAHTLQPFWIALACKPFYFNFIYFLLELGIDVSKAECVQHWAVFLGGSYYQF
jgi:hypothetical protein